MSTKVKTQQYDDLKIVEERINKQGQLSVAQMVEQLKVAYGFYLGLPTAKLEIWATMVLYH